VEAGDIGRKIFGFFTGHPMNVSFVDDHVCGSAKPMSKKELDWLIREKRVKAVLSVTETPLPESWTAQLSAYKHISVKNHHAPTLSQLRESVDFIENNEKQGLITDVHCAAGKGRTGTVLASYLCATENLPGKNAIEAVRAKRKGSIEKNSEQEEAVIQFCLSSAKKS
jgi:atypical dual specificity phosphatase